MLYRGSDAELRSAAKRLVDDAERGADFPLQRALISQLAESRRVAAVRPLVRAWACAAQVGRPRRRWFSRSKEPRDESVDVAEDGLRALAHLWAHAAPRQYNQIDQELRAAGYWPPAAGGAWWQLTATTALDAVPDAGPLRTTALAVLSCHPSGHIREAALRELVSAPLEASLNFFLVRANDWVRQVRTVAYARLLQLDTSDVGVLAPVLEQVEQLASQGRREPGAVEHLLNLLRTEAGLDAVRDCWKAEPLSLRRAAFRFSWDSHASPGVVLADATRCSDPFVRRWSVQKLADLKDAGATGDLRRLARDAVPMVAVAALDALDDRVESLDRSLLEELRCARSASLQLTARFMLEKHFGDTGHREVYLRMLSSGHDRSRAAAAIGLSATGEPSDHASLLAQRHEAGPRARRKLLVAAASLDMDGSRDAVFEDLAHPLRGVSKTARDVLRGRVDDTDALRISKPLESKRPHVRRNALLLAARLGHWVALPWILRAHRDPDAENATLAREFLDAWLEVHFHGVYRASRPSRSEGVAVRDELALAVVVIPADARRQVERALAGK